MIKLIHINSSARSGSTLLSILLDQYSTVFSGGELFRYSRIWTRRNSQLIADGTSLKSSEFWGRVKKNAELNLPPNFTNDMVEDQFTATEATAVQHAILKASDCLIICDSSKSPSYSKIIYNENNFSTVIIHLVRDGRAVVYSKGEKFYSKYFTAIKWTVTNVITKLRYRNNKNYLLLTYDQLVNDTNLTMSNIEKLVENNLSIKLDREKQNPTAKYMFAGNKMRHTFDGSIKYDRRYIDNMSSKQWWILTMIMLPGILLFNFPITRSGFNKTNNTLVE